MSAFFGRSAILTPWGWGVGWGAWESPIPPSPIAIASRAEEGMKEETPRDLRTFPIFSTNNVKKKHFFLKKCSFVYFKNDLFWIILFLRGKMVCAKRRGGSKGEGMKNDDVMLLWASHGRSKAVRGRGKKKCICDILYRDCAIVGRKKCSKMCFFELGVWNILR